MERKTCHQSKCDAEDCSELPAAEMTSKAMEAFLEAQAKFLEQQRNFAETEEARKNEMHRAQMKELEEREKLLKLQEEQSAEAKAERERKVRRRSSR